MSAEPSGQTEIRAIYSDSATKRVKSLFRPLSILLNKLGVSANAVTFFSFVLACVASWFLATDHLIWGLIVGLAMGFADLVDGQLAKEFGQATKFGSVLDSTVDRYNEFMVFLGFGIRYYLLGRPLWMIGSALAFFGSIMISYVKSRAEAAGYECKVGRLQRPERLTIMGVGALCGTYGVDAMTVILAVGAQFTAFYRLYHVWRQSKKTTL